MILRCAIAWDEKTYKGGQFVPHEVGLVRATEQQVGWDHGVRWLVRVT
jgi:hypothetical protein